MVQVAITSQITGRMTAVPEPAVSCHAPNDRTWSYQGNDGYDQGSTSPDPQGDSIPLGDGQPHLWDAEWEVPEGTSTTDVKCILEGGTNDHITGSGKLN